MLRSGGSSSFMHIQLIAVAATPAGSCVVDCIHRNPTKLKHPLLLAKSYLTTIEAT